MNRREVIAVGLASAGAAAAGLRENRLPANSPPAEISNRHLRARFETNSGRVQAWLSNGKPLLFNATVRAVGPSWTCNSSDPGLWRVAHTENVQVALGSGTKIVGECTDPQRNLTLGVEISLYDNRNALVLESWCRNRSNVQLLLRTLEPIRALPAEQGLCEWDYLGKALSNGFIYYDPGKVEEFFKNRFYSRKSMWNMGFASGDTDPGLTVGFVENDYAIGRVEAGAVTYQQRKGMSLIGEAALNDEFVVKPGQAARSGRFVLQMGATPFAALESYAQAVGDAHRVRLAPIINGWCPWFYGHLTISEDEVIRNAEFAARHLKPYGLEWVQVDDGYQRAFSDWEGNERFPHGMKWLADQIRELGLRPGIWIAPYAVSEGSEVFRRHPDWLIRNLDGSIRHCENRGETKLYGLDISVPAAADWFRRLFELVVNEWGYEFIKIDFVDWNILAAERFYDPTWSRAKAYRQGAEIMRAVLGPNRHLLDCGPAQITVGLVDSTRIELDQPFLTWQQYAGAYNSSSAALATRYYFHKRAWINDADHIGLALLTPSQAMAAASVIALSGGTMISGDRLIELDHMRLDILQKVYPSFGEAARPVDLFEREQPEIFALPVKTPFEEWMVVGIFNYDENAAVEKKVSLSRLGLDPQQNWLAFEFWEQRMVDMVRDQLRTFVPPASVALIALRKARGVPQVISTNRHFTQGGVELRQVAWDSASNTLCGTSIGGNGTQHNVLVWVPPGYAMALDAPEYPHDFDGYSVTLLPNGLVRVHVRFEAKCEVPWTLTFKHT